MKTDGEIVADARRLATSRDESWNELVETAERLLARAEVAEAVVRVIPKGHTIVIETSRPLPGDVMEKMRARWLELTGTKVIVLEQARVAAVIGDT